MANIKFVVYYGIGDWRGNPDESRSQEFETIEEMEKWFRILSDQMENEMQSHRFRLKYREYVFAYAAAIDADDEDRNDAIWDDLDVATQNKINALHFRKYAY